MNRKTFFIAISMLLVASGVFSQSDFSGQAGISLKASTNGLGADLYYRPFKMLAVKAGYEAFNLAATSETVKPYIGDAASISVPMPGGGNLGFDMGAKLRSGAATVALGFQPVGLFYLTAGVGYFMLNAQVTGTPSTDLAFASQSVDIQGQSISVTPKIAKDKIGSFGIELNPSMKIAPYVGIGLGSFVPRKHRVSFALEVGAYYMGAPKLTAIFPEGLKSSNIDYGQDLTQAQKDQYFSNVNSQVDGMLNDLKSDINTSLDDINAKLKVYPIYPVLKMTIGIRAL